MQIRYHLIIILEHHALLELVVLVINQILIRLLLLRILKVKVNDVNSIGKIIFI